MEIAPLFKILIVFAGILLLNRLRMHLGIALILGGVALDLWAGRGGVQTAHDLLFALQRPELWLLLVITTLIFEYGRHMAEERNARVIMNAARTWGGRHGRALSLMAIPATIGLVPMPGGALFSAPLVDQTARGADWQPAWKAAVNYWFRHVWEYWWPLFPVVIVTLSIFELEIWHFILLQLPLSIAALLAGYVVLIRPHLGELSRAPETADRIDKARGWMIALPLIAVVLVTLAGPFLLTYIAPDMAVQTRKLSAMLAGLGVGLVIILIDSGPGATGAMFRKLIDRKALHLVATIGGVMLFKTMLERSGLLPAAGEALMDSGVPLLWIVAGLPFVAGLVTGIAIGFAGIAFPLLAGLAGSAETGLAPASTLVMGFAFGYAGMMCSPVHLCFVLSRGYFSVTNRDVLRYVMWCSLGPLAVAVLLYFGLSGVGW